MDLGILDNMDWCCQCGWHNLDSTPDSTKYLKITGSSVIINTDFVNSIQITAKANQGCIVDKNSGYGTQNQFSSSTLDFGYVDPSFLPSFATMATNALAICDTTAAYLWTIFCGYVNALDPMGGSMTMVGSGNQWTVTWTSYADPALSASATIDGVNFTTTYDANQTIATISYPFEHQDLTYTATTVHRHWFFKPTCPVYGGQVIDVTVNGTLSNTYTSNDCKIDFLDLLSNYWNLGNDLNYPWRWKSFENNTDAPRVVRDEIRGFVVLPVDGGSGDLMHTGDILGKPNLEISGTAPFFDGRHPVHQDCAPNYLLRGYGQYSGLNDLGNANGVPLAATSWTAMDDALLATGQNGNPQGAFLTYDPTSAILRGGVWAEILVGAQGFNWARPCGAKDRFQLSGSSNCIDHISSSISGGNTNYFVIMSGLSLPDNIQPYSPCTASVWGTGNASADGLWIVSSTNGTCSLQTLLLSGSDMPLPSEIWGYGSPSVSPFTTFGNGQICRNKWVSTTPAFCGRTDIVAIQKNTPLTISLMEPQQAVLKNDAFYISGSVGATELNGQVFKVIPLGNSYTDFALSGTFSSTISTPYTSSAYCQINGAADYKWNSLNSRQTYVIVSWFQNNRDIGEYNRLIADSASIAASLDCAGINPCNTVGSVPSNPRTYQVTNGLQQNVYSMSIVQDCLKYNPCSPNVVAIMPTNSSSSFNHAKIYSYSINDIVLDGLYGNNWNGSIFQTMADIYGLYYPPCPCTEVLDPFDIPIGYETNCNCAEDSGDCQAKQEADPMFAIPCLDYYAKHPVFEMVQNPPAGAPTPLAPVGFFNQAELNVPSMPTGKNVINPLPSPPLGKLWYEPWWDYVSENNCVCNIGRFEAYYRANGVGCDQLVIVEEGI